MRKMHVGKQLGLFNESEDDSMRWIMLSLQPQYYRELCEGVKKTEYRLGVFVTEPVHGFVYCSSPVMEIGAYVKLGQPIIGKPSEIARIKEEESPGSYRMMMEWASRSKEVSAIPVESVQLFPPVTLQQMRRKFGKFHPPQRYIYLDKTPEVLNFLKSTSGLF